MITADIKEMVNRCSRCGKCRSVCPVFSEMLAEPYVARGKVQLLKALMEGALKPTKKYRELISFCLLCGECSEVCPNDVHVQDVVLETRKELVNKKGLPFVKRNVLQHFVGSNGNLALGARLLFVYQRLGLQRFVRKSRLVSPNLKEKDKLLPEIPPMFLQDELRRAGKAQKGIITISPKGEVKARVGYFTGCMSKYVFTKTAKNVIVALNRAGVEVVIPEQYCCGMPALTAGDAENMAALARKNIKSFVDAGVGTVITDCATCGSALKIKYPELLGQDLPFEVRDISEYLVRYTDLQHPRARAVASGVNALPEVADASEVIKVTYHDPCHLGRHMKIKEEPRELLKSIPGLALVEMRNSDRCCGASGSFQLEHQELSTKIGEHKVRNIADTGAQYVATGCPSCRLQLARVLREADLPVTVVHPVDLLFLK